MKKTTTIHSRHSLVNRCLWPVAVVLLLWACSRLPSYELPPVKGQYVVIQVEALPLNTPKFYTYQDGSRRVNFFVVRTDKTTEAYLDACMRCYPHKKGFRVEGFFVVCRYCSSRYPIDKLKAGLGTCYPISLRSELKEGQLYISLKSLKEAERYF